MRRAIFLVMALTATACCLAEAEPPTERQTIGLHLLERWEGSAHDDSARLLQIVEASCAREVRRILFRGPAGEQVVIETIEEPGAGLSLSRITDDQTGWWIELRDQSSFRFDVTSPSAYGFVLFNAKYFSEKDHPLRRTLSFQSRDLLTLSSTLQDWEFGERFADSVQRSAAAEEIARSIPAPVAKAILLWESALASGTGGIMGNFGTLVASLAPLVARYGEPQWSNLYKGVRWEVSATDTKAFRGIVVEDQEALSFAKRFASLSEPRQPLAGLEAPPDVRCPTGKERN